MRDDPSVEMVVAGAGEALAQVVMMGESDPPITASLGPIDRLICRLKSLEGYEQTLPVGLGVNQIGKLRDHLERFRKPLKNLSEMEETSFRAKWWMKEVRELCYDTEDYLVQSGAGVHRTLGRIVRFIISWIYSKLKWRTSTRVSRFMARAEVLKKTCEKIIVTEIEAANSLEKGIEALISLEREMEAVMETLTAQLLDMLAFEDNKQPQLKVVIISGFAGSGKTTLARTLYVKCKWRFRCSAFVRVSRNPDFRSLLTSILSQIKAPSPHGVCDVQGLIYSISDHLRGKRYFMVIDDVRSPSVWDIISRAFPAGNFRSRILVTTQSEQVEAAYSGYMLKSAIFKMGATDDGCAHTSTKENSKSLNIRYNNLPLHLRTCLLYLGMHPEGCTIRKDDLVKQWVAEVFIPAGKTEETSQIPQNKEEVILEISQNETEEITEVPQDSISEILQDQPEQIAQVNQDQREEIAGGYFDELVTRGMIQPVDINHKGEILSCTVHHLVLDLIKYKSREDNFLVVVDNLESTLGHPDIVRRLSVQFGCEKGASIPESIILSQVRSLTFYGFLECVPSFADYGLLRVLNLHIWADEDKIFDLTRIGELCYLAYLKIECNITVRLPLKIRRLQNLCTLELHAQVVSIPSDIGHLKKLLHVRCPCKADVWELSELTNLRDLQLTCYTVENLEDNMKCIQSVLEKLSSLRSIVLVPASGTCSVNTLPVNPLRICIVSPTPAHLQRLELSRRCCIFSTLPEWIGELYELCVLKIAVRELSREDIDILKGLPALTTLSLHLQIMAAEMIVFGKGGFSLLTHFKITCNVPWLKFEAEAMRNLEKLKLRFNSLIEDEQGTIPIIIIERLSGLKEIYAIIGSAGVDAGSAWHKAIRNDRGNPKLQFMSSIYYDDQGRGTLTREGSGEDENNEADISGVHMERESSSVPVHEISARCNEKESEDQPFMSEIISILSEAERTDGHVGQVFIEDSRELIQKTRRQTSERFKGMSLQAALSRAGENADHLEDMVAQMLVMLSVHGDRERGGHQAWDQLQGKLAQVATYVTNPRITADALRLGQLLEDARNPSSLPLGHPEAQALLGRIMASQDAGMAISGLKQLLLVVADQLDMAPLCNSDPVQLVDASSNFCEENVADIVNCSAELSAPDAQYAVVSIVGSQSSGKSYLLNRLFGTKFPVMDAMRGRSQTTRGIMMSRCIGPTLLVLDVEGFDGREKEQDTLFENQAALFALTVSDLMMVNISVFDIGREHGCGGSLFKTIFQERTKLPLGLPNIFVIVRHYNGEPPIEILREDVMETLEEMWRSVNKESTTFKDYIKINVVGLPDKDSEEFQKEVTALRKLLRSFRTAKVPASSFRISSKILWDQIKGNKSSTFHHI